MGKQAVWTCDGCGAQTDTLSLERMPKDWHTLKDGNDFMKGHICEDCYKSIFKRKAKAVQRETANDAPPHT